jgi:hypothetical protein
MVSNVAVLSGDKGQIRLEIIDYENRQAKTIEDANWLRASLHIDAGPFSGSITLGLTTIELEHLHQALAKSVVSLREAFDFVTIEGNLSLKVEFDRTGQVLVRGVVTPDESEENALRYGFHTDPITLERTAQALGRLTNQFPVKRSI